MLKLLLIYRWYEDIPTISTINNIALFSVEMEEVLTLFSSAKSLSHAFSES
jgi:hypothetical protein